MYRSVIPFSPLLVSSARAGIGRTQPVRHALMYTQPPRLRRSLFVLVLVVADLLPIHLQQATGYLPPQALLKSILPEDVHSKLGSAWYMDLYKCENALQPFAWIEPRPCLFAACSPTAGALV